MQSGLMNLKHLRPNLEGLKVSKLTSSLLDELLDLSEDVGYDKTIYYSGDLGFILDIYELTKKSKDQRLLKKAENMILSLSSLTHDKGGKKRRKRSKETAKSFKSISFDSESDMLGIPLNQKIVDVFHSIGIENKAMMRIAVGLLGENKIKDYSEYLLSSELGENLVKAYMKVNPEAILQPSEDLFLLDITTLEKKKQIFDFYKENLDLPDKLEYEKNPQILQLDLKEIIEALNIEQESEGESTLHEGKTPKSEQIPTLKTKEFIRIMKDFGFKEERRVKHGTFYYNAQQDARVMIQNPHRGQQYMETGIIREKLRQAGITDKEFMDRKGR